MLHDRVEDLHNANGAAVRYLLSAVSKNTVQTTLNTLEQFCNRSVEYTRYTIKCTVGALLSNRSEERLLLASKLVALALDRPNGITLVGPALDEAPSAMTAEALTAFMTNDLKLSPLQQMQFAMALVISNSPSVKGATEFLESFNLPEAATKEEDGGVRASALLARQMGSLQGLDAKLSTVCGTTLFPQGNGYCSHVGVASVLRELGTGCVTTLSDSRELLNIFPHKFTEKDVAEVLGFFASQGTATNDSSTYTSLMTASGKNAPKNVSGSSTLVNAFPLLDALNEGNPHFDWDYVISLLDQNNEDAFRLKNISVIFDAYHRFRPGSEYPPIALFLGRWTNTSRQRNALEYILRNPDKVNRKALAMEAPAELLPATKPAGVTTAELELWRSFHFVEAAIHVASRDKDFDNEVLRPAAEKMPLLFVYTLFLGSFTGTVKNFTTIKHLLVSHCPPLEEVAKHVLPEAEKNNRLDSVISIFSELTVTAPARTVEVLEMVLQAKSVARRFLKGSGSPRLVTAIAMCMDEAGEPSDKWLQKALDGKLHFRASSTENRFAVAMSIVEVAEMLQEKQVYVASATAALNALMGSPLKEMLKTVVECARGLLASTDSLFPEDVEKEATQFFLKMYSEGTTANAIHTIETMLKSPNPRDKQLYACVVNILFEESLAISCYPHAELTLFAELYGQMIARELLPPNQQQRAWGLLLPLIARPTNFAVEEYSVIVLEQIKPRLADWPQYARALRHIKDLDFRVPGIMAAINRAFKTEEAAKKDGEHPESPTSPNAGAKASSPAAEGGKPGAGGANGASPSTEADKSSSAPMLHTHDIGTLLTNRNVTSPPRVIQEQINFLIGNTDVHNIDNNARDLAQLLRPEYYEYFAEYLVVKRAALEPNYHAMYLDLISKLHLKELDRALRVATIAAVKRLLASDKIRTESSERILLRSLGAWLGSITLEKSIPILHQDLCFKDLIFQGLREGKLIGVISFMTRVLNSCARSRFFCCPNPWTMAQLSLLVEMYNLPHLKITLRFEVELMLKNLDVTVQDVLKYMQMHPSNATNEVRLATVCESVDIENSPDFRITETDTIPIEALPGQMSPSAQQGPPAPPQAAVVHQPDLRAGARQLQATAEPFLPKNALAVAMNPQMQAMLSQLDRPRRPPILITPETVHVSEDDQRLMGARIVEYRQRLAAMLRAVVEDAYNNFASRSVMVAVLSSYSIVVKDFTRDPAPEEMLLAGEAMSRSLASSLCFATVREVLPELLLKGATSLADSIVDVNTAHERNAALRQSIIMANEELCQRALEYTVGEEAAAELQMKMAELLQQKMSAVANNEPLRIPQDQIDANELLLVMGETLVPSGRMPAAQRDVYMDFFNCIPVVSIFNANLRSVEEAVSKYYSTENYAPVDLNSPPPADGAAGDTQMHIRNRLSSILGVVTPESAIYFLSPLFSKLMILAATLDRLTKELNNSKNAAAAAAAAAAANGSAAGASEASAAAAAETATNTRSRDVAALLNQIYLSILKQCVERGGEPVREEFTRLYLKSEHRYTYAKLTTDLIRIKILNCISLDEDLAKALMSASPNCVTYAGDIITSVIIRERLVTSRDMRRTLSTLDSIARSRTVQRASVSVPPSPSYVTTPAVASMVPATVTQLVMPSTLFDEEKRKMVSTLLDEWITMWSRKGHRHPGDERNPSVDFVKTLQQHGMLDTANLANFLGLSIRFCVEHYATVSLELERENAERVEKSNIGSKAGGPPPHRVPYTAKLFTKCDGFTDLVLVLLRCCSLRTEASREQRAETTLLKRVLEMFLRVLINHHDCVAQHLTPKTELPANAAYMPVFQQQPYVRLLSNLLIMIHRQEASSQREMSDEITVAFQTILHRLVPCDYPAFAFGWLELVSHRIFIARCMRTPELWGRYTDLIVDALKFVEFLTQDHAISPNGLVFYKSMFKLMLILLHDYPQFLISQHFPLCDAIPPYCVQMLNTVLCSFPPELRLPEPFQHVANDSPEMLKVLDTKVPLETIRATFAASARDGFNPAPLTRYVLNDSEQIPETVLKTLFDTLNTTTHWPLINAVVLHVALTYLEAHNNTFPEDFLNSNAVRFYRYMCHHFDTKHRYFFLCACISHLRYPNIQTNFFARIVFRLFLPDPAIDAHTQTCIQEQITRVVAEKTVIVQPHPWGVLNTFVELMRNPEFHFWEKSFIHTQMLEHVFTKLRRTVEARNGQTQPANGAASAQTAQSQQQQLQAQALAQAQGTRRR